MKTSFVRLAVPVVILAAAGLGQAQTIITNTPAAYGQSSYDFGLATVSVFLGDTATIPNAAFNSNNFLGIAGGANNNGLDDADGIFGGADQERMRLTLDSGYGLSDLSFQWARANGPNANDGVSISGFLADPGVTLIGASATSPTYSAGVLNFQVAWTGGTIHTASFANLAASDGATLEIVVADSNEAGAQLPITSFQVAVVPEPSTMALLGFGALGLLMARRRVS